MIKYIEKQNKSKTKSTIDDLANLIGIYAYGICEYHNFCHYEKLRI